MIPLLSGMRFMAFRKCAIALFMGSELTGLAMEALILRMGSHVVYQYESERPRDLEYSAS